MAALSPVIYRQSKRLGARAVLDLCRASGFYDWWTSADARWYVRHALFIATARQGRKLVGWAVLTGDGRINMSLDSLLVRPDWRGRGIGRELMRRVSAEVVRRRPHSCQVQVFSRRTQRFYERFGFVRNRGTWLLDHGGCAARLRRRAAAARPRREA